MDINGTNTKVSDLSLGKRVRRGTVTVVLDTGWGPQGEVLEFTDPYELENALLYSDTAKAALSDVLKRAERVYCCRPRGGEYAVSDIGRAKYKGTAGNRIRVSVGEADGGFSVTTYVDGTLVDRQTVTDGCRAADNDYVIFSGAELYLTAGISFAGGQDMIVSEFSYRECFDILSEVTADVTVLSEATETFTAELLAYIERDRLRGGLLMGVVPDCGSLPASEYITAVLLCGGDSGTVYYIAGLLASLPFCKSAVGEKYEGSFEPGAYENEHAALGAPDGRLVLVSRGSDAYIFKDNNCSEDGVASDNFYARLKDTMHGVINAIFRDKYCGKVREGITARSLLQKDIADALAELYVKNGISPVAPLASVSSDGNGAVSVSVSAPFAQRIESIAIRTGIE